MNCSCYLQWLEPWQRQQHYYLYRGRRTRSRSTIASSNNEPSSSASSSSFKNNHVDKGKKKLKDTPLTESQSTIDNDKVILMLLAATFHLLICLAKASSFKNQH